MAADTDLSLLIAEIIVSVIKGQGEAGTKFIVRHGGIFGGDIISVVKKDGVCNFLKASNSGHTLVFPQSLTFFFSQKLAIFSHIAFFAVLKF